MTKNTNKKADKKYKIIDLQGAGWWEFTEEDPMTEEEIVELFWKYAQDDGMDQSEDGFEPVRKKDLTLDFIQDLWECEIKEVTTN